MVESLTAGELKTGTHVFEDVIQPVVGDGATLACVDTVAQFVAVLDSLASDCLQSKDRPILHIEAHGTTTGLKLVSGPVVPWSDLVDRLRQINIASQNNLLVVMSACYGIRVLIVFTYTPLMAAPVRAVFGPDQEVSAGDLENGFKRFYKDLLAKKDPSEAAGQLRRDVPAMKFMTAEQIFARGFNNYLSKYCTRRVLEQRVNYIITAARKSNRRMSANAARKHARSRLTSGFEERFEKYKATVLMIDRYPDLASRFADLVLE